MKRTSKADLVRDVAENSHATHVEAKAVLEALLLVIRDHARAGRAVELRGFGTFYTRVRMARPAFNPRTGEEHPVPRRYVMLWRPASAFKQGVNECTG